MTNAIVTDRRVRHRLGPKMMVLRERQRKFVIAMYEFGNANLRQAAIAAGYTGTDEVLRTTGWRIAHDPKVKEAMLEHANAMAGVLQSVALSALTDIVKNPAHKNRFQAAIEIMNRTGMQVVQKIDVTKRDESLTDAALLERAKQLAQTLGYSQEQTKDLLKGAGVVIDAEWHEVGQAALTAPDEQNEDDLEDWEVLDEDEGED